MLIKPDRPSAEPLPGPRVPCNHCGGSHHVDQLVCDVDPRLERAIDRMHALRLLKALEKVEAELRAKGAIE